MHYDGLGPETFGVWRSEVSPSDSGLDALKSAVKRMSKFCNCFQDRNKALHQISRNENNNKHYLLTSDKEVIMVAASWINKGVFPYMPAKLGIFLFPFFQHRTHPSWGISWNLILPLLCQTLISASEIPKSPECFSVLPVTLCLVSSWVRVS